MSAYNISLYLIEQRKNRGCGQQLNKSALAQTVTRPAEKFKWIEHDFLNLALPIQGSWDQELIIRIYTVQEGISIIRHQLPVLSEPMG